MNKPVHEQLKELREFRRMQIQEISSMTGVPTQTIIRYERGESLKTIELLNNILKPLCAHLEIIQDIPLFYDSNRLEIIAKTGTPENFHENNFIKAYYKCRNDEEKRKCINSYLTRGSIEKESK